MESGRREKWTMREVKVENGERVISKERRQREIKIAMNLLMVAVIQKFKPPSPYQKRIRREGVRCMTSKIRDKEVHGKRKNGESRKKESWRRKGEREGGEGREKVGEKERQLYC